MAHLRCFTGNQPGSPDEAAKGQPLVVVNVKKTHIVDGHLEATFKPAKVIRAGKPSWYRVYSSDGEAVLDGQVGTDMTIRGEMVAGQPFVLNSYIVRLGKPAAMSSPVKVSLKDGRTFTFPTMDEAKRALAERGYSAA